jgi:hypothetical protein
MRAIVKLVDRSTPITEFLIEKSMGFINKVFVEEAARNTSLIGHHNDLETGSVE